MTKNTYSKLIRKESEKLALKAKQRGFSGKRLSMEERDKLAREYLREK